MSFSRAPHPGRSSQIGVGGADRRGFVTCARGAFCAGFFTVPAALTMTKAALAIAVQERARPGLAKRWAQYTTALTVGDRGLRRCRRVGLRFLRGGVACVFCVACVACLACLACVSSGGVDSADDTDSSVHALPALKQCLQKTQHY